MEYIYLSPIGELHLIFSEHSLLSVFFGTDNHEDTLESQRRILISGKEAGEFPPVVEETRLWFDLYFDGEKPRYVPNIQLEGSDFQKTVWNILLTIPCGQITTYRSIAVEVARKMGRKSMSAQAVGQAVGHNPVAIIVPCHRVVGSDRTLTGYAWGIDRKKWLLRHEGITLSAK